MDFSNSYIEDSTAPPHPHEADNKGGACAVEKEKETKEIRGCIFTTGLFPFLLGKLLLERGSKGFSSLHFFQGRVLSPLHQNHKEFLSTAPQIEMLDPRIGNTS